MSYRLRTRSLLVAALALAVVLSTSPSFARGGRGGGGRAGGGGARPSGGGGGHPGGGPNTSNLGGNNLGGSNFSRNLGGQPGQSPRNLAGGQQLQGALGQAGGIQNATNAQGLNPQNLQGQFQQQAGQFQQRNPSERSGQAQQAAQDAANQFQNRAEPFSPAWYAEHPQAWQYTHPHADAAAVATAAGVAAWLGAAYYTPVESSGGSTTVVYQQMPAEEPAPQDATAEQVAPGGAAVQGEWLPLGTYSLATSTNAPPTVMLQLAVDHAGQLKGVYYDSLTNTTHNLAGNLNRATQIAEWSLETNPQFTFKAPVDELLKPTGTVQVNLATGPQNWQLTRVEKQ